MVFITKKQMERWRRKFIKSAKKNIPEILPHDPINEMLKQLYQMINQLGQLDKSIILLYLEDKSYEEIAEITGLTVTNVATKLSRIKDKLKRMKKEE